MMNLEHRVDLLVDLGNYMRSGDPVWAAVRERASAANPWFTPEFVGLAVDRIASEFLDRARLTEWIGRYPKAARTVPRNIGLIMAGNIPLVGFHDLLSIFISGHRQTIKPSSRDEILIRHLVEKAGGIAPEFRDLVTFADRLKGCDAFIGTGSNNSARYFDYYFGKYPHIIRRNRTSVALLTGSESKEELEGLADDTHQYFGLGCRNVTKLLVPEGYDFIPMLQAFRKYAYLSDLHKYHNNYEYNLAILILNKKFYMTNGTILLTEEPSPFSPIGVLHYGYYKDAGAVVAGLQADPDIQCIVGQAEPGPVPGPVPFGMAQRPTLADYADGVDTLDFLLSL